jgi:hypothetical protein
LLLFGTWQTTLGADRAAPATLKLEERIREASRGGLFRTPSTGELSVAERLFAETFRADQPLEVLQRAWRGIHFQLQTFEAGNQQLWLLRELPSHRTGRGFYVFRPTAAIPVVLEAPHSFADRNTRPLTARLFVNSRCAAAAWNTVHRKIADLAHTEQCFLNAFTRAFLRVQGPQAMVCQLHGFAREKRATRTGRTSDIIVSNGSKLTQSWLYHAVADFRSRCPEIAIRLYPGEVSELGATTNWQGRVVRETVVGKFLHLELSAELRTSLINGSREPSELLKILECALRTE